MNIHLRYNGKSSTVTAPAGSDKELIDYLEQRGYLQRPDPSVISARLWTESLMIDRHPDGVVIRPPAVFG